VSDDPSNRAVTGKFSELTLRIISALVLIAIFLPLLWLGGLPFWVMCLVLSGVLFYEWAGIVRNESVRSASVWWWPLGLIYAAIPIVLLPPIRDHTATSGLLLILFLFLIVAVTDVAAYFAGRSIGGPKLMPRVSPKKTWSGAIGGLTAAFIVGIGFAYILAPGSVVLCAIGAAVLSVFSQAGDLFESSVKRHFGVKDSSNLIPGHGGFMDRLDGLLIAAIPLALYTFLTAN